MKDTIVKITEEYGNMFITLKDGKKIPVKAITKYTYWKSGRKDCSINIEEPLTTSSECIK